MKQRDIIKQLVDELEEIVSFTREERAPLDEQELDSIRKKIALGKSALKGTK